MLLHRPPPTHSAWIMTITSELYWVDNSPSSMTDTTTPFPVMLCSHTPVTLMSWWTNRKLFWKEMLIMIGFNTITVTPISSNSRSNANFSFQFIASYVWYSTEKLAGDLLLGSNANFSFQFIASYVWYSSQRNWQVISCWDQMQTPPFNL